AWNRARERISARCPCRCARRILNDCCAAARMASLSIPSRSGPSARTYSAPPAEWDWKAWSQNAAIGPIVGADQRIKVKNRSHAAMVREFLMAAVWIYVDSHYGIGDK